MELLCTKQGLTACVGMPSPGLQQAILYSGPLSNERNGVYCSCCNC